MSPADLAGHVQVDPKSVERWVRAGRTPHPRARAAAAAALGVEEETLWPRTAGGAIDEELVRVWPTRSSVPHELWSQVLSAQQLDVLVYSGGHLLEAHDLVGRLRELSAAGGRARVCVGDASSEEVARRAETEGWPWLTARTETNTKIITEAVAGLRGVEVRRHATPLYVSIYRGDDLLLANLHTFGLPAPSNPVLQLQRHEGQPLFGYYGDAFERVWATALA